VVTVTSLTVAARYFAFTAAGTVESEVSRKRVPMAMPAAPYASAATSPRPSWKPPAATTGMATASTTCGSSTVVATSPVWPPPSPPCTITASAPQAATFSACRRAPTEGTTTTPASFSSAISSREGARAKDATRTPSSTMIRTRSPASSASARRFTPNGASVRDLTSRMASLRWSRVIVAEARMPSAPAFAAADTRRGPATQPIPVCTTG
jgi:hypothetical protein